jgi:AraC family transcriptional regulator of adaptative response/methylated-DNA-[protein]-cysteine methyltransferase
MEGACRARDASYDGLFLLAVRTTGVFCRPSCPARPPRPENVEFFGAPGEALAAGYRPCLRCRPLEAAGTPPAWAASLLAEIEEDPAARLSDRELARRGLQPVRVRRLFRREYGMTFQAFRRARRLAGAASAIRAGTRPEDAGWDAGYESASGFRDAFSRLFGAPPRRGGAPGCVRMGWTESPIGPLLLGVTDDGVCLLEFSDRRGLAGQLEALRRRFAAPLVPGAAHDFAALRSQLAEYFAGRRRAFDLPLSPSGTPFQRRVWARLLRIRYGETRSYEDLARAVGRAGAQRAVGQANGRNPIAIVIPCHRVVNKGGRLGGYGGGLWRKRFLLDLERRHGEDPGSRLC